MNKEEQKDYARINKEISITLHKMGIIEARLTKEIWLDRIFDKEIIRKAELTLRLDNDNAFKMLQEKYWGLEERRQQFNYFDDIGGLGLEQLESSSQAR